MTSLLPIQLLYVEDDAQTREAAAAVLEMHCQKVTLAGDGAQALELAAAEKPDIVVTSIVMPGMSGFDLIAALQREHPQIAAIITTPIVETGCLLKAMELGVSGFARPLDHPRLLAAIEKAAKPAILRRQLESLQGRIAGAFSLRLGSSPAMDQVAQQAALAAGNSYNTVIEGEPGVGKTYLAGLIHLVSEQSRRPFIVVPCAGAGEEQLERELFGKRRWGPGKLAVAAQGTVVLQHVDQVGLALQSKLAYALEEGRYLPTGAVEPVALDCRIIATVRGGVALAHGEGRVCDALFYRLAEQVISLPPLRAMSDDLLRLARGFLAEAAEDLRRPALELDDEVLEPMSAYPWPGNVRQLKNIMRRAALCGEHKIGCAQLQALLPDCASSRLDPSQPLPPFLCFDELERRAISDALKRSCNKKMQAAELLGIDYKRFKRKLEKHGL